LTPGNYFGYHMLKGWNRGWWHRGAFGTHKGPTRAF